MRSQLERTHKTYLPEAESPTCPQKYRLRRSLQQAYYPNGDSIRYCPDTIVASSAESRDADIIGVALIWLLVSLTMAVKCHLHLSRPRLRAAAAGCNKVWKATNQTVRTNAERFTSGKLKASIATTVTNRLLDHQSLPHFH